MAQPLPPELVRRGFAQELENERRNCRVAAEEAVKRAAAVRAVLDEGKIPVADLRQLVTESWHQATRAIDIAMAVDGVSAAQIATRAGVRQLVVAQHITDPRRRAAALAAARHDAKRYAEQVLDALRQEALWRWDQANGERGAKSRIADDLKITRQTLDTWIADCEESQP